MTDRDVYITYDRKARRLVLSQSYGTTASRVALRACDFPALLEAMRLAYDGRFEVLERSDASLRILETIYTPGFTREQAERRAAATLGVPLPKLVESLQEMVEAPHKPIPDFLLPVCTLQYAPAHFYVRDSHVPTDMQFEELPPDEERKSDRPEPVQEAAPVRPVERPKPTPVSKNPGGGDTGLYSTKLFD